MKRRNQFCHIFERVKDSRARTTLTLVRNLVNVNFIK